MDPPRHRLLVELWEERHTELVWRAMLRRLGDPELAKDAAQELFIAVEGAFPRFDPALGSFEAWIMGFVNNIARRHWVREAGRPQPRESLPETPVEDRPPTRLAPELRDAINALPVRDRMLLILRAVEGWPAAAVGERLGMNTSNVNTAFARICSRLAKRLELPDVA